MAKRAGIGDAIGILGEVTSATWHDELVYLAFYNLLWFICCLPLVTIPPATAALYVATREITHHHHIGWRDFLKTVQEYFMISWRWGILNFLVGFIFWTNLWFYTVTSSSATILLAALWWGLLVLWLIIQMYTFPILLEQEEPQIRLALRNAVILCLQHPLFTLVLALVMVFVILLTFFLPVFVALFTASLTTFIYNKAIQHLLQLEKTASSQ